MAETPRDQPPITVWTAPLMGALRSADAKTLQHIFTSLKEYLKTLDESITANTYTLTIGSVTTGTPSSASITGTFPTQTLNLTLEQGPTGATGATGPAGPQGPQGFSVLNGVGAPSSGTGIDGDFYIDTSTETIYGPKTAGAWGAGTSLIGSISGSVLDDLADVTITSVSTGQMLKYSGSGQWINTNILDAVDSISSPEFVQFDLAPTAPNNIGKLMWSADDGTFTYLLAGGNVEAFVGQAEYQLIYNNTGSTLNKGQVVYVDGAQGQRISVALADADTESTSSKTFGVVAESITNGSEGFVTTSGMLRGVDTSAYADGTALWLSSTPGGFTGTMPSAPVHAVLVGWVVKSHAVSGEIFVKIQNGYELNELHNVSITSPTNGQGLVYNSTTGLWENGNVASSGASAQVMTYLVMEVNP